MSDYTPTTEEVRETYAALCKTDAAADEFDRWLSGEIRKAKAEAWAEGITASGINLDWQLHLLDHNPYTEES